jgi:LPXTG-motif cell wall-anchored protein
LPQETSGDVTAVGCLVRGTAVRGGKKDKYALARVKKGPVASVPEATCTVDQGADALTVDNPEKGKITDAALGRWVQITGRLEKETDKDPDNLRELDVATFKLVPVVVPTPPAAAPAPAPRAAAPAPAPAPRAAEPMAPAPTPTPTPEPRKLPKTGSQLPAIGLAGLLSLAAGLTLRSFRLRQGA